eukprot:766987-Hanusia_phi.AAC.6
MPSSSAAFSSSSPSLWQKLLSAKSMRHFPASLCATMPPPCRVGRARLFLSPSPSFPPLL